METGVKIHSGCAVA